MFNKSLVVSLLIIGITWTQAVPLSNEWYGRQKRETSAGTSVVFGSRDQLIGNTYGNSGQTQDGSSSSGQDTQKVHLSITNQDHNRYVVLGKVGQTLVVVPSSYGALDNVPYPVPGLSNTPSKPANILTPERRYVVQVRINQLKRTCEGLKMILNPLINEDEDSPQQSVIADILSRNFSIKVRLNRQQTLLDNFNETLRWTAPKEDNFDRDLTLLSQGLNQLMRETMELAQRNSAAQMLL